MLTALTTAPALIIAGVLIASGVAKLRHPGDEAEWAALGLPVWLRRGWLIRLHPYAEILLGLVIALVGWMLGALAALVAVALFAFYLVLVQRARRRDPEASCSCFGSVRPITGRTLVRNSWFVLLSAAALAATWSTPLLGGPLRAAASDATWLVALAATALTVWLSIEPEAPATKAVDAGVPVIETVGDGEQLDYIRTRIPSVPVVLANGDTVNLRHLVQRGPILLLAVKEGCAACAPVIESVGRWRALIPEVSVRFLLRSGPDDSALTEQDEPQSLHDEHNYVRDSIDDWPTPTAVLLGADGLLAGGPVSGFPDIDAFISDIYESLHGERPPVDAA